jgi:hypothetical protein
VIARVSLELALRKEFDYLIPPDLVGMVDVGSRVQVPFGPRKMLGCVTALAEESAHTRLKSILKVIGAQTLVTPKILKLARWIGEYYCCPAEIALKSVLPEAVRKEKAGWRERLYVRALPPPADFPKLSKRQREIWNVIEERREMPLRELVELAETTAGTIRHLEDKGLVTISSEISERDPYAGEHILPTSPLDLNLQQVRALAKIIEAMGTQSRLGATVGRSGGGSFGGARLMGPARRGCYPREPARVRHDESCRIRTHGPPPSPPPFRNSRLHLSRHLADAGQAGAVPRGTRESAGSVSPLAWQQDCLLPGLCDAGSCSLVDPTIANRVKRKAGGPFAFRNPAQH